MREKKRGSTWFIMLLAILAKSAKLAKLAKFFKVAKPLVLLVSMSISAVAYAFLLGPWLSVLFVVLLLVHEMGHVVAMRMKGFDTPTPVFIPFLGAAIFAPKFEERHTEAFVAYGGPLLGTIGTLFVFSLWFITSGDTALAHILLVGSYLGAYLNLFNLLPISPLDGGRITQAAGRWFKYIGLLTLVVLSVTWRQPVILYIWILVLIDLDIVPVRLRAVLVPSCWLAMVSLMALGYGDQPVWLNVVDCVITLPFAAMSVIRAVVKIDDDGPDDRPDLTPRERMGWLALYIGLGIVLAATLAVQFPYLPRA